MHDVACQERAAAAGSILARCWAELIRRRNAAQYLCNNCKWWNHECCNAAVPEFNPKYPVLDSPSHAKSQDPPGSAQAHSPASPGPPQGTAKALENKRLFSSTAKHAGQTQALHNVSLFREYFLLEKEKP